MKQIDWFSFYPKAIVLKNHRSCFLYYFSVLCKSFSKNSFFWLLLSSETSVALATEVVRLIRPLAMTRLKQASFFVHLAYRVRSRKRMQRYSFFGHEPNVSREKFIKRECFNSYLHFEEARWGRYLILYVRSGRACGRAQKTT